MIKIIASTFSPKSDLILNNILKKYNLGEPGDASELILTKLTMKFSRGEITEKDIAESIQTELRLTSQNSQQITQELKNIIPTLWDKMPKEERDVLLNEKEKGSTEPKTLPKIKSPTRVSEIIEEEKDSIKKYAKEEGSKEEKIKPTTKKPKRIKKTIPKKEPEEAEDLPQKSETTEQKQKSGHDSYRESIE